MLEPATRLGAPPLGSWQIVLKVLSAVYLEILREALPRRPASIHVQKKVGRLCSRVGLKINSADTVIGWRKDISRSRGSAQHDLFHQFMTDWRSHMGGRSPTTQDVDAWMQAHLRAFG